MKKKKKKKKEDSLAKILFEMATTNLFQYWNGIHKYGICKILFLNI